MEASAVHLRRTASRGSATPGLLLRLRSDEQLLALFRAGNDDAFQVIHDRYRPRLLAYVRQMLPVGVRSDAEDALQDVFIRAYGALRADERPVALRAWLYRVAHNRCIDTLRRPAPTPVERSERECDDRHDPCDEAERRETLGQLVSDLQRLPEAQRSCLLLRELEGLSYAELGVVLAASQPAVKSLLVRARMGLADASEARGTGCEQIRADLAASCERGIRMSSRARLHLRDCESCSAYHKILRTTQKQVAGLAPASGPLATLLKVLGLSGSGAAAGLGGGGGAAAGGTTIAGLAGGTTLAAKVAVVMCVAAVTTGEAVNAVRSPAPAAHHQRAVAAATPAQVAATSAVATPGGRIAPASERRPQPAVKPPPAKVVEVAPVAAVPATTPAADQPPVETTGGAQAPDEPSTDPVGDPPVTVAKPPSVTLNGPTTIAGDGLSTSVAPPPTPAAQGTAPATPTAASTGAAETPATVKH